MRVAVLTSGGDSPGMNAYLYSLAKICEDKKINLFSFHYGFKGLLEGELYEMASVDIFAGMSKGGTIIGSSRCKEFATVRGQKKAIKVLGEYKIDILIIVGGNGSLKGAKKLSELGFDTIGIPGSVDNDLSFDYSLGYDSAVNAAMKAIDSVNSSCMAMKRISIVELMGRDDSSITDMCGKATNADVVINQNYSFAKIKRMIKHSLIKNPAPLVLLKEKMLDSEKLLNYLQEEIETPIRFQVLGYTQRGGDASAFDRAYAHDLAQKSVEMILNKECNYAIGYIDGKVEQLDYLQAITNIKKP